MSDEEWKKATHASLTELYALSKELGGQLSGEHGIGNGRIEFLEEFVGPRMIQLYKAIKLAFDDKLKLNPGKIVRKCASTLSVFIILGLVLVPNIDFRYCYQMCKCCRKKYDIRKESTGTPCQKCRIYADFYIFSILNHSVWTDDGCQKRIRISWICRADYTVHTILNSCNRNEGQRNLIHI